MAAAAGSPPPAASQPPPPPAARLFTKLALSAAAGATAETATFPLDLLKTRMQLAGRPTSLLSTAASIVRQEGLSSLYAGLSPAVLRHLPYTGIRVLTFERLRSLAQRHFGGGGGGSSGALPLPVTLAMGATSGGLAQLVAVPADLVKIRMQADGRLVAAGLAAAPR